MLGPVLSSSTDAYDGLSYLFAWSFYFSPFHGLSLGLTGTDLTDQASEHIKSRLATSSDPISNGLIIGYIGKWEFANRHTMFWQAGFASSTIETRKDGNVDPRKIYKDNGFYLSLGYEWTFSRVCLLYTSPSPRDQRGSRMPSSA